MQFAEKIDEAQQGESLFRSAFSMASVTWLNARLAVLAMSATDKEPGH